MFAELDGDGRPDRFVSVDLDDDSEATDFRWMVQLNSAAGWLPKQSTGLKADCPARVTDLNGDGRAEFLTASD